MNRRLYYDIFSLFYDRIIALHSRDSSAGLRKFLIEKSGAGGDYSSLLDICTGTGAVPLAAAAMYGGAVRLTGLDFSSGMLKKAYSRASGLSGVSISFVQADASSMPFRDNTFGAVTCSHAMYELRPDVRENVLAEASRVLVHGGRFAMMEHCEPEKPFIRFLYRVRLAGLGQSANLDFAKNEVPYLRRHFSNVTMEKALGGRSKVIWGVKA